MKRLLYSLSHPQKRIWYMEEMHPGTPMHNIGGVVSIQGITNVKALSHAIEQFIRTNDALQLRFINRGGEVLQYVEESMTEPIEIIDFSGFPDPWQASRRWAQNQFQVPLFRMNEPLYRFAIMKISECECAYLVVLHHIIADGWSNMLMTRQINQTYAALLSNREIAGPHSFSYLDWVLSERSYLHSGRYSKDKQFWSDKMGELPEVFLYPSSENLIGQRSRMLLSFDKSKQVLQFARNFGYSVNTLFATLMSIVMSKKRNNDDIMLGIPVLNRSGKREKQIVGMFTSVVPYRSNVDKTDTFASYIKKVNRELLQCFFHQKYPYDQIVQELDPQKQRYNQLFQICVNYYNTKMDNQLGDLLFTYDELYSGYQHYSMQLVVKEWDARGLLELQYDYKSGDYQESEITLLHEQLIRVLDQVMVDPKIKLGNIEIMNQEEYNEVTYRFNLTEADYPHFEVIQQLISAQAMKTPDRIALIDGGDAISYRMLVEKVERLACVLYNRGVRRGDIAGIVTTHSFESVIAILAVLRVGAAYLPIDPNYPAERIRFFLEDSRPAAVLTNVALGDIIKGLSMEIIQLDNEEVYKSNHFPLPEICYEPDDTCYVIYTSGSTGKPKGVMISNRGLLNYIWWAKHKYIVDANDVFALFTSLAFDLTITSIFTPLVNGNAIVIYREDGNRSVLERIVQDKIATIVKLTPAHLSLMKDYLDEDHSIRTIIVGGEELKKALAKEVFEKNGGSTRIFNEYGPTETVVGCMIHLFDPNQDVGASIPIGQPIHNMQIYILDENLQPVPPGTPGEMYIGGDGVAKGYLNHDDLTIERFLPNPFRKGNIYKSGDLAVFLPTGIVHYLGRSDTQVKMKGYRIEPFEIESCLISLSEVAEAVVSLEHDEVKRGAYLKAYIILARPATQLHLKRQLMEKLPAYMVPETFVSVKTFPLTPNGKVDRAALSLVRGEVLAEPYEGKMDHQTKKIVLEIFMDALKVEQVTETDHFFILGGDSVKAIQIASKLQDNNLHVSIEQIMAFPVLGELMSLITHKQPPAATDWERPSGTVESPIIQWFIDQDLEEPDYWHQSVLLSCKTDLKFSDLQRAVRQLIQFHDIFRTMYDPSISKLVYRDHVSTEETIVFHCGVRGNEEEIKNKIREISMYHKREIRLSSGLLFRALMFTVNDNESLVLLLAHHLVVDAVSWSIIIQDLSSLICKGEDSKLTKTDSYQAWCKKLKQFNSEKAVYDLPYWSKVLESAVAFPTDHVPQAGALGHATESSFLSESDTKDLVRAANAAYNTNVQELLVAALGKTISSFTKSDEVELEIEGHGRDSIIDGVNLNRTVGWFTNLYPVVLSGYKGDVAQIIKATKEQLRQLPNKGISYGTLKYLSGDIKDERKRIRFNYLGDLDFGYETDLFQLASFDTGPDKSERNQKTSLLEIISCIKDHKLQVSITFSNSEFLTETIASLLGSYISNLICIIRHCVHKKETDFTPSDFDTLSISEDDLNMIFQ